MALMGRRQADTVLTKSLTGLSESDIIFIIQVDLFSITTETRMAFLPPRFAILY